MISFSNSRSKRGPFFAGRLGLLSSTKTATRRARGNLERCEDGGGFESLVLDWIRDWVEESIIDFKIRQFRQCLYGVTKGSVGF